MTKYNHKIEFHKLGTSIKIEVIAKGEKELEKIKNETENIVRIFINAEDIFSRFKKKSELMRLNRELGVYRKSSKELVRMAKRYLSFYDISRGVFDPRVIEELERLGYDKDISGIRGKKIKVGKLDLNNLIYATPLDKDIKIKENKLKFNKKMDFSGAVKGRVNDLTAGYLKEKGFENFKINSGGDLYLAGKSSYNRKWRINVKGILEDKMIFNLSNCAISTSAEDRRYWQAGNKKVFHLIAKKKIKKADKPLKVSVIAKTSEEADFFATYLFLKGKTGFMTAKKKKIAAMFAPQKGEIKITRQMKEYLK